MAPNLQFPVSSEQCEILCLLQELGTAQKVAQTLGRDISTVNRQLKAMADRNEVIEKRQGGWAITPQGNRLVVLAREFLLGQREILNLSNEIRIITTREFAARVLSPSLNEIFPVESKICPVILTSESGAESFLRDGSADIGIDCEIPHDPSIRSKSVTPELFSFIAAPTFAIENGLTREGKSVQELNRSPHLQYTRAQNAMTLPAEIDPQNIVAKFNDLAAIRAAAVAGIGWTLFPNYACRAEIESGELVRLCEGQEPKPAQFRISYLRERKKLEPLVATISQWLKRKDLDLVRVSV